MTNIFARPVDLEPHDELRHDMRQARTMVRAEFIYKDRKNKRAEPESYETIQREELEDFIVMLEKRRNADVGFWVSELEAGPLKGALCAEAALIRLQQSYDEAISVIKKQIAAIE